MALAPCNWLDLCDFGLLCNCSCFHTRKHFAAVISVRLMFSQLGKAAVATHQLRLGDMTSMLTIASSRSCTLSMYYQRKYSTRNDK